MADAKSAKDIPEALLERYSSGQCVVLALVINRLFGLPLKAQVETIGGEAVIAHAYNTLPKTNQEVDIYGIQEQVDVFSDEMICQFRDDEAFLAFIDSYDNGEIDSQEYTQAEIVVQKYLQKDIKPHL